MVYGSHLKKGTMSDQKEKNTPVPMSFLHLLAVFVFHRARKLTIEERFTDTYMPKIVIRRRYHADDRAAASFIDSN